ncbi:recombinase family protein [Streptomyces jumonjinensis]|uniref:Recombinase family protein n=1 Tax=Streptomyces jumonjinensis TaxID=1945 RepID=A0A646KND6_STRJU|nr:recombinase family protein [Streptomyces jumonjinensis]MQT03839.1 recombinase family protein [Streptomyces jumonjinensis]
MLLTDPASGRQIVRCFIYARMSADREGAGLGCERQIEDCYALAEQLSTPQAEYRVVKVFQDNDLSAYSGKPRPDYIEMMDALRSGDGDCVLAWHTDRLHRSPAELETYIDVCEPRRIDTRTVKAGHLDLTTATGRMIARQLGVQARYEVERMVERQRRARDQMAQQGRHFGGRRPFGYEDDHVTPRSMVCPECAAGGGFSITRVCDGCGAAGAFHAGEECRDCRERHSFAVRPLCGACGAFGVVEPASEAAYADEAADAVLAGASLRSIAADWRKRGIATSTGGDWEGPEVGQMLLRPRNAGIVKHRGKEAGRAGWVPIIEESKWRSVVAILTDESRRITPGNQRKYLGSNIYVCGVCGATMRAATAGAGRGSKPRPSYSCRVSKHLTRQRDLLDDFVQLAVLERISRPDAADLLADRDDPVDVLGAQTDMREARGTLDELAAALGAGEMDMQEWRVASQSAKQRLEKAQVALAGAVKANPVVGLVGAEDPDVAWAALDLSRKRAIIATLMTITVLPARPGRMPGGGYWDPDAVRIEWK